MRGLSAEVQGGKVRQVKGIKLNVKVELRVLDHNDQRMLGNLLDPNPKRKRNERWVL